MKLKGLVSVHHENFAMEMLSLCLDLCTAGIQPSTTFTTATHQHYSCHSYKLVHFLQLHVWGGIGRQGATPLVLFNGTLNAIGFKHLMDVSFNWVLTNHELIPLNYYSISFLIFVKL